MNNVDMAERKMILKLAKNELKKIHTELDTLDWFKPNVASLKLDWINQKDNFRILNNIINKLEKEQQNGKRKNIYNDR